METLSDAPVKVSIATTPQTSRDGVRALDQDVALTKAALLYANEVEIVSLGVSMFDSLRQVIDGGRFSGFDLIASLDDATITYLRNRGGNENTFPDDWRGTLRAALSIDPATLEAEGIEGVEALRELHDVAEQTTKRLHDDLETLLEEQGATELVHAVRAGAVKIADLAFVPSSTLRPTELDPSDSTDVQMWNWIDALVTRLTDRKTRLLFDRGAGDIIQSMFASGMLPANDQGLQLAAQAALGAGFAQRLPAFDMAKMDELLDMRKELAVPLARYRGAVIRFSKDVPRVVGKDLDFEVEQLWQQTVVPELITLEDQMADHGLVKELARSLDVKDIRDFATWTAGAYFTIADHSALEALTTGLIATAAGSAATLALDAVRARRAGQESPRSSDFFYLYEANRRFQ